MTDTVFPEKSDHWFIEKNPLLEGLPKIHDMHILAEKLAFAPIKGLDVSKLSMMDKNVLLVMEKMPLEPTLQSLRTAMTILGMLYGSLQVRNPLRIETRKTIWSILNAAAIRSDSLPPGFIGNTSVQVLMGITGTGKTALVRRICSLLPEKIVHGPCPEAGWVKMTQLVYIYTNMSTDGSRGGFLTGILTEIDKILGTSYREELPRKYRTVEKLAVATIALLHTHYTGIIFVDEGQLRNLMESNQAELMQLFLLGLINTGIPMVLIGNPTAFGWIHDFSQDIRRMYERPIEFFHPAGAIDDNCNEWDAIFEGVAAYYVLSKDCEDKSRCSELLKKRSGGIPGIALSLWCNAQRGVLLAGGDQLVVEDIEAAYQNPGFNEFRDLADGFASRDPVLLSRCRDIPVQYYAKIWGKPIVSADESSFDIAVPIISKKSSSSKKRTKSSSVKLKAEQTRKRNQDEVRKKLETTLSNEDIRRQGVNSVLLGGLAQMKEDLDKQKK